MTFSGVSIYAVIKVIYMSNYRLPVNNIHHIYSNLIYNEMAYINIRLKFKKSQIFIIY